MSATSRFANRTTYHQTVGCLGTFSIGKGNTSWAFLQGRIRYAPYAFLLLPSDLFHQPHHHLFQAIGKGVDIILTGLVRAENFLPLLLPFYFLPLT
jgi:hypothetical protein